MNMRGFLGDLVGRAVVAAGVAMVAVAHAGDGIQEADGEPRPCEMRVESELFENGGDAPTARSLTVFDEGVAWDFLEMPARKNQAMTVGEIVLHDPARERVLVIDPVRHLKTQIDSIRLERMSVSLAKWARGNDDRLIRWAGGPDFTPGFTETDTRIELAGPRVRYAVAYEEAPSPEAAGVYRQFADTAILLKALMQPGGIPPFPRLAVNRRLEDAGAIPAEVTLEIDSRLTPIGRPERLRCVHTVHPRLLAGDRRRIEDAKAHIATSDTVDLATFVERESVRDADGSPEANEPGRLETPGT
ncbi:MAG: hypothetical protein ACR2IT_04405 [Pirellulales bacterium]